jgi:kinesin family protein 5
MAAVGGVRVFVRFRPENGLESAEGGRPCVEHLSGEDCMVGGINQFTFDRVFEPDATQTQVYDEAAREIVESVLDGYNGTILAYGQTASGKTYTMEGPDIDDPAQRGVVPRMVRTLLDGVARAPSTVEFVIGVSMLEIYMERIRDLLAAPAAAASGARAAAGGAGALASLAVHEERGGGVYVQGLTQEWVSSEAEVFALLKRGVRGRATGETRMSEASSRSHSVVLVTVRQRDMTSGSAKTGKLCLVDLAGSEKLQKTWATGVALEEAKTINKSLSALGNVINALTFEPARAAADATADAADGASAQPARAHVPYRDSKLTRVLQESLGGNARTALIVTASASTYNLDETLSSLRFGQRAKRMRNKPLVNLELSSREALALFKLEQRRSKALGDELEMLRALLGERRAAGAAAPADASDAPAAAESLRAVVEQLRKEREARLAAEADARARADELAEVRALLSDAELEMGALAEEGELHAAENDELFDRLARERVERERLGGECDELRTQRDRLAAEARVLDAALEAARARAVPAAPVADAAALAPTALEAAPGTPARAAAPAAAAPAAAAPAEPGPEAELRARLAHAERENSGLISGLQEKIARVIELEIELDSQREVHRRALDSVGAWGIYDELEQLGAKYKALEREHAALLAEQARARELLARAEARPARASPAKPAAQRPTLSPRSAVHRPQKPRPVLRGGGGPTVGQTEEAIAVGADS